jgi:hypothetical protein
VYLDARVGRVAQFQCLECRRGGLEREYTDGIVPALRSLEYGGRVGSDARAHVEHQPRLREATRTPRPAGEQLVEQSQLTIASGATVPVVLGPTMDSIP